MKKKLLICLMLGILTTNSLACSNTKNESSNTVSGEENSDIELSSEKEEKNDFNETTNTEIAFEEYLFNLPSTWTESDALSDQRTYYAESGDAVAMFQLLYSDSPAKNFDEMYSTKDSYIDSFGNSFDTFNCKNISTIPILDTEGILYEFSGSTSGLEIHGKLLTFINETSDNLITVSMIQSNNTAYSYFNDFEKILKSIKLAETEKPSLDNLPLVTWNDIVSGNYDDQTIAIDGVVDDIDYLAGEVSSFNMYFEHDGIYDIVKFYVSSASGISSISDLKNGDILRVSQVIVESQTVGQGFIEAQIVGETPLKEIHAAYKSGCPELDYESAMRIPVGSDEQNIKCKFTGEIFQIVDEGSEYSQPTYLIKSSNGNYVYVDYFRDFEYRDIRFIEGDIVTIYGEFVFLTTYDTLTGENTVPEINAYLIDLE